MKKVYLKDVLKERSQTVVIFILSCKQGIKIVLFEYVSFKFLAHKMWDPLEDTLFCWNLNYMFGKVVNAFWSNIQGDLKL